MVLLITFRLTKEYFSSFLLLRSPDVFVTLCFLCKLSNCEFKQSVLHCRVKGCLEITLCAWLVLSSCDEPDRPVEEKIVVHRLLTSYSCLRSFISNMPCCCLWRDLNQGNKLFTVVTNVTEEVTMHGWTGFYPMTSAVLCFSCWLIFRLAAVAVSIIYLCIIRTEW